MARPTLDTLLSEKVLYPLLGVILLGALILLGVRPRHYGSAADFSLPVVSDAGEAGPDRVSLRDLRGHPVLLDFWATWCGPCRFETPILVRLHQRFQARGLVVIGVNVDEGGPIAVPAFRRHFGIDYPLVYDEGMGASGHYGIEGLPTLVLIDRAGQVRMRHPGMISESELAQAITDVL